MARRLQLPSMRRRRGPTYRQDWSAYNQAQTHEKDRLLILLAELCAGITEPVREKKPGRKPLPLRDSVFSAVFKIYSTFSARRFMSDLRIAHERGPHLSRAALQTACSTSSTTAELTPDPAILDPAE